MARGRRRSHPGRYVVLFLVAAIAFLILKNKDLLTGSVEPDGTQGTESTGLSASLEETPEPIDIDAVDGSFYFEQLSDNEKQVYGQMLKAMEEKRDHVLITPLPYDAYAKVRTVLAYEHPELILSPEFIWSDKDDNVIKAALDYDSSVQKAQDDCRKTAEKILADMPDGSDYDKARYLFEWLCDNVDYDYDGVSVNDGQDIRSALLERNSVCNGYAQAYTYLCHMAGLECVTVGGYSRSEDNEDGLHAWNLLKLDGKYYWCDATYGDTDPISWQYFCMGDRELNRVYTVDADQDLRENDDPSNGFTYPVCDSDRTLFALNGYVLDTGEVQEVDSAIVSSVERNGCPADINLEFASAEAMQKGLDYLLDSQNIADALYGAGLMPDRGLHFSEVSYDPNMYCMFFVIYEGQ